MEHYRLNITVQRNCEIIHHIKLYSVLPLCASLCLFLFLCIIQVVQFVQVLRGILKCIWLEYS